MSEKRRIRLYYDGKPTDTVIYDNPERVKSFLKQLIDNFNKKENNEQQQRNDFQEKEEIK